MAALPDIPAADLARIVAAVRGRSGPATTAVPHADVSRTTVVSSARVARAALVLFFALLAISLHSTPGRAWIFSPTSFPSAQEFHMHRMKVMAFAGTAAGLTALSGVGVASAQDAVQWRVEDGGNGHWYQAIPTLGLRWPEARDVCVGMGGYLVTMSSAAEDAFARALTPDVTDTGFWIGASRQSGVTCSATAAWRWVDGSLWNYTGWNETQPQCWEQGQIYVVVVRGSYTPGWHDFDDTTSIPRAVIEWSADCNSDGIVDYGQIRAGELVDANANNIPDCCEESTSCTPCPGDIDESGTVNGVDLAAILTVWGSDGGKYPRADTNNDGEVNGADLATVLGTWGSCE